MTEKYHEAIIISTILLVMSIMSELPKTSAVSFLSGERVYNDKLIHMSEHVKLPINYVRSEDVAFPKYYEDSDNVITAIHVRDNWASAGSVEVDYGGIGMTFANIHLRSAPWTGYNFTIQIYACLCIGSDEYGDLLFEGMSGTLERTVKTYHCAADNVTEQQIILYGNKAWTFPTQTVNLTLTYPSANSENEFTNAEDYLITSLLVVLYMDGSRSRGYITQGGIFSDHLSMTFVVENISRLSYQFWLYGVSKPYANVSEVVWQNFC